MGSQQQATVSILLITAILSYVLWSLLQTGGFLPYISAGTPSVGNIMLFILLVSGIIGGIGAVLYSLVSTISFRIKKRENTTTATTIFIADITVFFLAFISLILHVFKLVPIKYTLLSYAVGCGIVGYGKFKDKNRYKKYITGNSGTGESKDSVKV